MLPVAMKVLSEPEKMAWRVEDRHRLGRPGCIRRTRAQNDDLEFLSPRFVPLVARGSLSSDDIGISSSADWRIKEALR
jgi:hypothetical protein